MYFNSVLLKWFHSLYPFFACSFSYRAIVLRALPNLEMLDNVSVTPEELADAMKAGNAAQSQEEIYEDAYSNGPSQQQTQQQQYQQQPPQQQQQQQQFRQSSPVREVSNHLCYAIKSVILGQNFVNAKKKFFKRI